MTRILIEPDSNRIRVSLESDELGAWTAMDGDFHPFGSCVTRRMIAMGSLPSRVVPDADHFHPARFLRVVRGMWN